MCSQHDGDDLEETLSELLRHEKTIDSLVRRIVRFDEVADVKQELRKNLWQNVRRIPTNPTARISWLREFVRRTSLAWLRRDTKQRGGKPTPMGQGGERLASVQVEEVEAEVEAALASQARLTEHPRDQQALIQRDQEKWRWRILKRAIDSLPAELRDAYVQVKLRGRRGTDVASDLEISRTTLISRIRKADDLVAKYLRVGAIDCVVLDQEGRKLSTIVRLRAGDGSASIRAEHTNGRDPVRYEGLAPGDYVIAVTTPGYVDLEQPIVVAVGLAKILLRLQTRPVDPTIGGPNA